MKKMLYLMSIDWGWIVQRPQLLANELQKYYDVTVVCTRPIVKRWKSQTEFVEPDNLRVVHYLPMQEKYTILKKFNHLDARRVLSDIDSFDYVFVGGAEWWTYLTKYKGTIIYDCMDDYYAMQHDEKEKEQIFQNEANLVKRANIVLASSNKLKDMIRTRYQVNDVEIVRNGIRDIVTHPIKTPHVKEKYILGYIGTVASWMDFSSLKLCTSRVDNVDIHMIGPAPGYETDYRNRISFDGICEHAALYNAIEEFDCLMMPFILNDIVLAVDPVKLYEYISFGKCIISVFYPEVERFNDFVYFYHDQEELVELIKDLIKKGFPPKYDKKQQENFLRENTWKIRASQIYRCITSKEHN